jgi:Zn-dependent oligopeptidase
LKPTNRQPTQVAHLLGYSTWAAYVQETLMAKNPQRVDGFLKELEGKLSKVGGG